MNEIYNIWQPLNRYSTALQLLKPAYWLPKYEEGSLPVIYRSARKYSYPKPRKMTVKSRICPS